MRHPRAEGGPEAVDAAGVHEVALRGGDEQRHEGAAAVVDATPADAERAVPLLAIAGDEAATAYEKALALGAKTSNVFLGLAIIKSDRGQTEESERFLPRAIEAGTPGA